MTPVWLLTLLLAAQTPNTNPQGKIVAIQGDVQHAAANRDLWDPAKLSQSLYTAERVRTLVASGTAILFIDETQVKLNANAILTVQNLRQRGGGSTNFNLLQGEGWFRTKNPTGGVTIRGNQTVLTVTEGPVEFRNDGCVEAL